MNDLIESLEKFTVTNDAEQFDTDLDMVIYKMKSIEHNDDEWTIMKINFSKLKYLRNLIKKIHFKPDGKFLDSLVKFMDQIDKSSQYYLHEINFELPEYPDSVKEECKNIKTNLETALNQTDILLRIDYSFFAIQGMIDVIQAEGTLVYLECPPDDSFIKEFEQPAPKRLKKNIK
jgi:hypothetical protein